MTQHIRGGLDGVCVQPTVKRGLCPSCLGDRVGEVRKFRACRTSSVSCRAVPRGREAQPPRSGCESVLSPGMHAILKNSFYT